MMFAAPFWLTLLAPLAAVVAYVLLGRRKQEAVPFLDLWIGPVTGARPTRRFAPPPLAVALAILALLLAVLGAARPALWNRDGAKPLTIIVDRGATMSVGDRWGDVAQEVQKELVGLGPMTPVDLIVVPGGGAERLDLEQWMGRVGIIRPTAVDTTAALNAAIAGQVAATNSPLIVVTDRPVGPAVERVVRAAPERSVGNVGITSIRARATPRAQVMVRVRNDAVPGKFLTAMKLRVSSGGREVVRPIEVPPPGASKDYFIDLEVIGDVIEVQMPFDDHFRADNAAWLVREGSSPRIEPRGPVPPELQRMIDVYAGSRPPAAESPRVAIFRESAAPTPASTAVVLAETRDLAGPENIEVRPHPVTRDTRWSFREPVRVAPAPPAEWMPVVRVGERVAVAVRESPTRQVWIGLDSDEWPRTPEYVVFWANVFDWLGGGETRFVSHPLGQLDGAWEAVDWEGDPGYPLGGSEPGLWPGLYRRVEDGALRALDAGEVRLPPPAVDDWRPQLARAIAAHARGAARPISSAVLLGAGACGALAVMVWKRGAGRNPAPT